MTDRQGAALALVGLGGAYLLYRNRGALPVLGPYFTEEDRELVPSVTTYEGYDLDPYGGPTTYPQPIVRFAQAIAKQEGFYVAGSIPQRANNPGDLKIPNSATLPGTQITRFASVDEGWNALYRQLFLILTGQSSYYNLDMSIEQMAQVWTTTQQGPWALNVASYLGVSTDAKLWQVLA